MINLAMLSSHEDTLDFARLENSCRYSMGLDFLLRLQTIMGNAALSAALGELYRTINLRLAPLTPDFDWYIDSDPEIYEIILKHTPG